MKAYLQLTPSSTAKVMHFEVESATIKCLMIGHLDVHFFVTIKICR